MSRLAFLEVTTWVFDLDNTLYPPQAALFDQIEVRMTDWVSEELGVSRSEADKIRDDYWRRFGTTLTGLMDLHDIDPGPYLTHVHEISLDHLTPDAQLRAAIEDLPGRKIVFTNGTASYAGRVTEALGLSGVFDALYGVEEAGFRPKPERAAFEQVFAADGFDTERAAMFEDDVRNLEIPHTLGMRTVHVAPEAHPEDLDHVHHHTDNIWKFLNEISR